MKKRPFLLVLGMHRSGTSALAGVIDRLGFSAGGDVLPPQSDNPKGFWENIQVVSAHDSILEGLDSAWDDPASPTFRMQGNNARKEDVDKLDKILVDEFSGVELPYLKDPRLCQFIDVWLSLLNNQGWQPKCLIILRNPLEVAESLHKRNNMGMQSALLLWIKSNLNVEFLTRGVDRYLLSYDDLLSNPKSEISRALSALGYKDFDGQVLENAVSYIDINERHHVASRTEFGDFGLYGEMAEKIYCSLLAQLETSSTDGYEALDNLSRELDYFESLAMPWVLGRERVLKHYSSRVTGRIEAALQSLSDNNPQFDISMEHGGDPGRDFAMMDNLEHGYQKIITRFQNELNSYAEYIEKSESQPVRTFIRNLKKMILKNIARIEE